MFIYIYNIEKRKKKKTEEHTCKKCPQDMKYKYRLFLEHTEQHIAKAQAKEVIYFQCSKSYNLSFSLNCFSFSIFSLI